MPRLASSVLVALVLAATGGRATAGGAPPVTRWLSSKPGTRVVHLLLVAGYDSTNNGFNFDGYARGRMLVRVPRGWRVTVSCRNAGSRNHSCAVVHGAESTRPAFPGAAVPSPFLGVAPGRSASFAFRASRVGVFRLACLVPGHEAAREYDVLKIVAAGRPGIEILSSSPG